MNRRIMAFALLFLALSGIAEAIDITACSDLNTTNGAYLLTANVTDGGPVCFNFTANNVTLDCQGHSVLLNGTGVLIENVNSATIKNCVFPFYGYANYYSINATNTTGLFINGSEGSCVSLKNVNYANLTYLNLSDQNCRVDGIDQFALSLNSTNNTIVSNCNLSSVGIGDIGVANNYALRIDNESYSDYIFNNFFKVDFGVSFAGMGAQAGCTGGDDNGVGNLYIYLENDTHQNTFNTTRQVGTRVYGNGFEIGGNYYERTSCSSFGLPDIGGISALCTDANTDGFCDSPLAVIAPTYEASTCTGTEVGCSNIMQESCENSLGCTWSGSACSGTCTSCETLNSSVCNDQLGCGWNNCGENTDQESCEINSCVWGSGVCTGSSCVGSCKTCSDVLRCEYYTGCTWSGSVCEGVQNTCESQDNSYYCHFNFNCSWTTGALITNGTYDYLPLSDKANVFTMRAYDESTGARIYFTATIVNSTNTTNTGYQYYYQATPSSIANGQVSVVVSNTTYYQSKYVGTIPANGVSNLDAYLQPLSNLNVKQVSFLTTSASSQALPGVLVSINRLVNGATVSVGQAYTDSTGMASFYMDSTVSYTVTASLLGYSTVSQTIIPTQTTYTITMGNWTMGIFHQTFYDIQWIFSPSGILDENKTHNLTFSTFSSTGKIVWFAWKIYNGTTLLRLENITSPMGGTVNYSILPGPNSNITVYFYIMRVNMSEQQLAIWYVLLPLQNFYNQFIANINRPFNRTNDNLTTILKNLGNQANNWGAYPNAISSFTLVLGTLIVGVITSAWVGRFSPTGGQLVFVIVMAIGTYMGAGLLASVSLLIFIIIVAVAYQLWRSGG
jgi:hypothetical protein